MSFKCPNCDVKLTSRVYRLCQTCGSHLPAELLLPEAEIRHHENKMKRVKKARLSDIQNVSTAGPEANTFSGSSLQP